MSEHCCNNQSNCPVCSTPTDRSKPEQVTVKVTHCKNCPMGEYWDSTRMEGYNCHADPSNIRTVILVTKEHESAEDRPLPDDCDIRTKTFTIKLNQ